MSAVVVVGVGQELRKASWAVKRWSEWRTATWLDRKRVPARTLKFGFGVGVLLGEGSGNIGPNRGRLRAVSMLVSFPFKAGSTVDKAKSPDGRSASCLHVI